MSDEQSREDWRHERSLLALGRAMRGDDEDAKPVKASLLSIASQADPSWREDAAARHRLVRSRREATAAPPLSAFEETKSTVGEAEGLLGRSQPADALPSSSAGYGAAIGGKGYAEPEVAARKQFAAARAPTGGIGGSKRLIAAMTAAGAILGAAVALALPTTYEATAELSVNPQGPADKGSVQPDPASGAALAFVESQARVITSGMVLNKVVDKLDLVEDPEFNGQGGGLSVMSLVRSVLSRDDAPGGLDEGRRHALAAGNLADTLSVEPGNRPFAITVAARTGSGAKSALIANTVTDAFIGIYGDIRPGAADEQVELRDAAETAEREVEDFKAAHNLTDIQGTAGDGIAKLEDQLASARARTLELNAKAASARSADAQSVLDGIAPEQVDSSVITGLRARYRAIKQDADQAAVKLGSRNPERLALADQLAGVREQAAAELRRISASLQGDLKRAVQLEQDLSSRLARIKDGSDPGDLAALRDLEREAEARRADYEASQRAGESRPVGVGTADISVVSKAIAPLEPNGPSRVMVTIAGLLLGLASGLGLAVMRGPRAGSGEADDLRSDDDEPVGGGARPAQSESGRYVEPAMAEEPPGSVASMISAVRNSMSRNVAWEDVDESRFHKPIPVTPAENMHQTENSMYRYPEPTSPFATQQSSSAGYPQPQFQQAGHAPQSYPPQAMQQPPQQMYPQMQPQPYPQGYPYAQPLPYQQQAYPQPQSWQPAPQGYPYQQPMPAGSYSGQAPYPPQPSVQPQAFSSEERQAMASNDDQSSIEEIRASLREFRDAVRQLTESRTRRRIF